MAIFLPISLLLSLATWALPPDTVPALIVVLVVIAICLFAGAALMGGLFLLAKLNPLTSLKRMVMVGIIIPLGSSLTLAWIAVPVWAYASSIVYLIPATLMIIPVTLALRGLSVWVCRKNSPGQDEEGLRAG